MDKKILNSNISAELEKRLSILVNNHLEQQKKYNANSAMHKIKSNIASLSLSTVEGAASVLGLGVGIIGIMVAIPYGGNLIQSNFPELGRTGYYASALLAAGAFIGIGALYNNVYNTIKDRAGILSLEDKLSSDILKIEKELKVSFKKEDLDNIFDILDNENPKNIVIKAVSNAKIRNR